MAASEPKPTETTTDESEDKSAQGPIVTAAESEDKNAQGPIVTAAELQHFQELGLGRGVDSSNPQLWKNKSAMQIRTITADLGNIIATNESGIKNSYEKTVSSLKMQQTKIQGSLSDPTSQVKIGMDAQYSQSFSTTNTVKGTRVTTRTISFRHDFNDLPIDSERSEADFLPTHDQPIEIDRGYSAFENSVASWILKKLLDDQDDKRISPTPAIEKLKGETAIEKLTNYSHQISGMDSKEAKSIKLACRAFISEFGITHYVCGIELGALSYSVHKSRTQSSSVGAGANVGTGSAVNVSGGISTSVTQKTTTSTKREQKIGHYNEDGVVRRGTSDEAVIGFDLHPINKLFRVPTIRLSLTAALETYLQRKTDDTLGPFLISTSINKRPVYWKVEQEQFSLIGTEDIKAASLFYVISAGDQFSPANFSIAHWGDKKGDRKLITNMTSRLTQLHSTAAKLPTYLTTNASLFGSSDPSPLFFKRTSDIKTAQYTAHNRMYSSFAWFTCVREPVSLQAVLEGDEFYIKHSPHAFKSVYLALKQETGAAESPSYTSTVFPSIKYSDKEEIGMLFRIHPYQLRDNVGKCFQTSVEEYF